MFLTRAPIEEVGAGAAVLWYDASPQLVGHIALEAVLDMEQPKLNEMMEYAGLHLSDLKAERAARESTVESLMRRGAIGGGRLVAEMIKLTEIASSIAQMEEKAGLLKAAAKQTRASYSELCWKVGLLYECVKKMRAVDPLYVFPLE